MVLTLLFISPRVIGNGFFKFASLTAAILMGVTLGFDFLFPSPVRSGELPVISLVTSALLTAVYNRVIAAGKFRAAFLLLVAATAAGLVSITADSLAFTLPLAIGGWENWILVINHLAATALLGSVMLTMVFGHWYLVVPRLSIEPLKLLTKVLMASIGVRIIAIVLSLVILGLERAVPFGAIVTELVLRQGLFFWPRLIFGVVLPIVLASMIWSTVQIRHTQAATGLLYLAAVALLFGEFFSKFLLFSVSIPM